MASSRRDCGAVGNAVTTTATKMCLTGDDAGVRVQERAVVDVKSGRRREIKSRPWWVLCGQGMPGIIDDLDIANTWC
jgi:hypothetical protein